MANSVDPDQAAPIGAVCSGPTLLASVLNSSVIVGNYLQQTSSADDIFRCIFFFCALRVNGDQRKQQLKGGRLSSRHQYLGAPLSDINPYVVANKDYFAFLFWGLSKPI